MKLDLLLQRYMALAPAPAPAPARAPARAVGLALQFWVVEAPFNEDSAAT